MYGYLRLTLLLLPLLLLCSCRGGKGRIRIQGEYQNLTQTEFLLFSPDGGVPELDTLRLERGRFDEEIPVTGGPYTFTILYPNFSTLSFIASEGADIRILGDALALGSEQVEGADSVIRDTPKESPSPVRIGAPLPHTEVIDSLRRPGRPLLIGFWANWKGGTVVVNMHLGVAVTEGNGQLDALSYSLDVDPTMFRVGRSAYTGSWPYHCDFRGWNSPDVRRLGIHNIPYFILLDADGRVLAAGEGYEQDIAPALKNLRP